MHQAPAACDSPVAIVPPTSRGLGVHDSSGIPLGPADGDIHYALSDDPGQLPFLDEPGLTTSSVPDGPISFSRRVRRISFLPGDLFWDLQLDAHHFLSRDNLPLTLAGLGVAGWLANSNLDEDILRRIQRNISVTRTEEYHEFISEFKFLGDGYVLLPVYAGSAVLGRYFYCDHPFAERFGQWGERSFRGIVIGTPTLLLSQWVLGSGRPGESVETSEWQFFADDNGVSGHAFMGAVPFLTAMHQSHDVRWKTTFFVLSTLPGLSRLTENAHYPSQVLLGWGLAWLATQAVDDTERTTFREWTLSPILGPDRMGFGVTRRY